MKEEVRITEAERDRAGKRASLIGMALNFALAVAKIVTGFLAGLISVLADGINNLSDCGSGAVSFVSFRISAKPADKEHPFGHRRAEYVASMLIAVLVLVLAAELFRESLEKIISGEPSFGGWQIFLLLGISIAVKAGMFLFYKIAAKKSDSDTLRAAAVDSACDCLATLAVIIGLVISRFAGFPADGWAGVLVALFIVWQGVAILRDAGSKLLGQAPDPQLIASIKELIVSRPDVLGMHDLRVYGYGKGASFATAHIEMDAAIPAVASHEIVDGIEREVFDKLGVHLTAHYDPVDLNDEEAREAEARVRAAVEGMYDGMNVHDFRMVRGVKKTVVFEVGIPFSCKESDKEILSSIVRAVRILGDFEPVVEIERE